MTGQIGKPGCGPFSSPVSRMQWEDGAGGMCNLGYRHVQNPQDRDVAEFWNRSQAKYHRRTWDIITGLENGEVGCLWIVATNRR